MRIQPTQEATRSRPTKWHNLVPVLPAAITTVVALGLSILPVGTVIESEVMRAFYVLRGPITPPDGVVMVSIDDETYHALNVSTSFPIPHSFIAEALERVVSGKPRLVMLDAKFPLHGSIEPEADSRIESALKKVPSVLWNGVALLKQGAADPTERVSLPSDNQFRRAAVMELSMPDYLSDSTVLNISASTPNSSELVARIPVAYALNAVGGANVELPGRSDLIKFYGPMNTIHHVSLASLTGTSPLVDPARLFQEKVVVIGYASVFYGRGFTRSEEFRVPVSDSPMFETEIHATVAGNLLEGSWLRRLGGGWSLLPLLILTLLCSFAVWARPTGRMLGWLILGWTGVITGAYVLFAYCGFWADGLGCCTVVIGLNAAGLGFYFIEEFVESLRSKEASATSKL